MSDEQTEDQRPRFGSGFAQMFGYVTPEDRGRWEQQRAQSRPAVSATRRAVKSSLGALLEFGDQNLKAKLGAAHRVAAQQQFDESHDKVVIKRADSRTRSIVETVDYGPRDGRQEIEPDLEL